MRWDLEVFVEGAAVAMAMRNLFPMEEAVDSL
jgi:hypothetical protein